MNKEIYEKILFVDKILNATINPRSYRYFRDIKKYILECDEKVEKTTNYYLKTLAKNGSMPDEAVEMFNLLEGNK
jgi:hypothetical protein